MKDFSEPKPKSFHKRPDSSRLTRKLVNKCSTTHFPRGSLLTSLFVCLFVCMSDINISEWCFNKRGLDNKGHIFSFRNNKLNLKINKNFTIQFPSFEKLLAAVRKLFVSFVMYYIFIFILKRIYRFDKSDLLLDCCSFASSVVVTLI